MVCRSRSNIRRLVAATALAGGVGAAGAAAAEGPKFEVFGFAMLDYIQDFKRVNPAWDATLRPSKIPTVDGIESDGLVVLALV